MSRRPSAIFHRIAARRCLLAASFLTALTALAACISTPAIAPASSRLAVTETAGPPSTDVLTQHGDPQRTGANLHETLLTPESVASGHFGRWFEWIVDGQIYTQPLYVSNVKLGDRTVNLVVVATMNNGVYAFEAPTTGSDLKPPGKALWEVHSDVLGEPLPFDFRFWLSAVFGWNIKPQIGITSTPVIDRTLQRVFLIVKSTPDPQDIRKNARQELVALDLLTGAVKGRRPINPVYRNAAGVAWSFDAAQQLQRASLLEFNHRIYAAFGAHQDETPYHGWLIAWSADDGLQELHVYCTTCGDPGTNDCRASCMGGIWQAGGGPAADLDGNLYVISGNGGNGNAGLDKSTSFIKLDPDLKVIGSWTPASYRCLNRIDADLGSAGPTVVGSPPHVVGGGKEGVLYALAGEALRGAQVGGVLAGAVSDAPCLGGPRPLASGPGYTSVQAAPPWDDLGLMDLARYYDEGLISQGFHHIHGAPVQWTAEADSGPRTLVYISAERDRLRAYDVSDGALHGSAPGAQPVSQIVSKCANSAHGMPGGFLTLSANGAAASTGILWASMPRYDMNALTDTVPGILRAYRAYPDADGTLVEIWNSDSGTNIPTTCGPESPTGTDQVGRFAKFVPPTVADGRVYLSTFSGRLAIYALNEARPPNTRLAGALRAAAAEPTDYDASLILENPPTTVTAGAPLAVTIVATNQGALPWHAGDGIRLGSQTIPASDLQPTEGSAALDVADEVPPRGTYTFRFHVRVPDEEAVHFLSWRLERSGASPGGPLLDWIGSPTTEWSFTTLRPECAEVHRRAREAVAQLRADASLAPSMKDDLLSIRDAAGAARCGLGSTIIEPMTH